MKEKEIRKNQEHNKHKTLKIQGEAGLHNEKPGKGMIEGNKIEQSLDEE